GSQTRRAPRAPANRAGFEKKPARALMREGRQMRSLFPYNLRASFGRRVIAGISRLDRYRAAILGHYETCQTLTRYRVSKFVGTPRPLREVLSQTKFGCDVGHFG